MKRALIVVAVLVSSAAAACGSSNSSSTTTGGAPAGSSSNSSSLSLPLGGGNGGNFCDLIKSYTTQFNGIGASLSDPAKAKTYFQAVLVAIGQLVDAAPDELKSDGRLIQSTFTELVSALDAVNYDFTKIPASESAKLDSPDVKAANTHLDTYVKTVCGFTPGSTP